MMTLSEHGPLFQPCLRCKRVRELAELCERDTEWNAATALHDLAAGCPRCRGVGSELTPSGLELFKLLKPHMRVILASLTREGGDK